jgi:hypothetical protein
MYSKKLTFTTTQLNLNNIQSGLVPILMNPSGLVGGSSPYYMYPRTMRFVNNTGAQINFGLIANDSQFVEYQQTPANFALIPVANGYTWTPDMLQPLPSTKYLFIQGSGIITSGLDVYFMNYASQGR